MPMLSFSMVDSADSNLDDYDLVVVVVVVVDEEQDGNTTNVTTMVWIQTKQVQSVVQIIASAASETKKDTGV